MEVEYPLSTAQVLFRVNAPVDVPPAPARSQGFGGEAITRSDDAGSQLRCLHPTLLNRWRRSSVIVTNRSLAVVLALLFVLRSDDESSDCFVLEVGRCRANRGLRGWLAYSDN